MSCFLETSERVFFFSPWSDQNGVVHTVGAQQIQFLVKIPLGCCWQAPHTKKSG